MKPYGLMRIKNEQRWIGRVLDSMIPVCEKIYILDDHSTDETREICRSYPQVALFESPFQGLNETRDKNWILEKIEREVHAGSWIMCIDGDEEIAPGSGAEILRIISRQPVNPRVRHAGFRFQVLYLWDEESQYRADGIYADFHRSSMFKLVPGQRFKSAAGGGFHCGNAPEPGGAQRTSVKLLHYGYLYRSDRLRKYEWYNSPDKQPIPAGEDGYRHMVIGDIFPATAKFQHAGPLELRPLPC